MKAGRRCRRCGALLPVGSRRKYCPECLREVMIENITSLRSKKGKSYLKWRRGMMEALGLIKKKKKK